MTDDEAEGEGLKWRFLDDVRCERSLIRFSLLIAR